MKSFLSKDMLEITFSGRMSRRTYWRAALVFNIASIFVILLLILIGYLTSIWIAILLGIAVCTWATVLCISYAVRRLHDVGKSGSYFCISFIPLIGGILLLMELLNEGVKGDNEYGSNPKNDELPTLAASSSSKASDSLSGASPIDESASQAASLVSSTIKNKLPALKGVLETACKKVQNYGSLFIESVKIAKKEKKVKKPLVVGFVACFLFVALLGASFFGASEPTKSPKEAIGVAEPTKSPKEAIGVAESTKSPKEAIEILRECGIINPTAMGKMVMTTDLMEGTSREYKQNPIKIISEDVLQHFSMYQNGVEKLEAYPYIDKILELYRRANTEQEELQAQGLAKIAQDFETMGKAAQDLSYMAMTGREVSRGDETKTHKRLPVQCLQAFAAKGVMMADFDVCRSNIIQVNPRDKELYEFIYSEICGRQSTLLNVGDNQGFTPLMRVAQVDSEELVSRLIKAGANVNAKDNSGWTPLMYAARYNASTDVSKRLLDKGAKIHEKNNSGANALMLATYNISNKGIVEFLIKKGAELEAKDNSGWTALLYAARYGTVDTCEKLIAAGAEINAKNQSGYTPLMLAPLNVGNKYVTDALIKAGADINAQDNRGYTLLMRACMDDVFNNCYGPAINMRRAAEKSGNRAQLENIYTAEESDGKNIRLNIIRKLLKEGADLNVKDKEGCTLLSLLSLKDNELRRYGSYTVLIQDNLVQELVDAGAKIDIQDKVGQKLFAQEMSKMPNDILVPLLKAGADVNACGQKNMTPLMRAIELNELETCKMILKMGADVNAADDEGITPVMMAFIHEKSKELRDLLLQEGADINAEDNNMKTLLYHLLKGDNNGRHKSYKDELVQDVIKAGGKMYAKHAIFLCLEYDDIPDDYLCDMILGKDVDARDEKGWTSLMHAASIGKVKTCERMMALGADINAESMEDGMTPLMLVLFGNTRNFAIEETAAALLKAGASVNAKNKAGDTLLLQILKRKQMLDIIPLLVANGATLDTQDEELQQMLLGMYNSMTDEEMCSVIQAGANVNARDEQEETKGWTPLMYAVVKGKIKTCEKLIEKGADLNAINNKGLAPLTLIMYKSDKKEIIDMLISAGADVNVRDSEGNTPLLRVLAISTHELRSAEDRYAWSFAINTLLDAKADPNLKSSSGKSAFVAAVARECDPDIIKKMIEIGGDIDLPDEQGETALMSVCKIDSRNAVDKYIAVGADVNSKDINGWTPLMYAAYYSGNSHTIKKLIEAGADPNSRNAKGETALMLAAISDIQHDIDVADTPMHDPVDRTIATLIKCGADVSIKTDDGKTAMIYAKQNKVGQSKLRCSTIEIYAKKFPQQRTTVSASKRSITGAKSGDKSDELVYYIAEIENMSTKDATAQLYQKRLLTLLPMIRDGADVNVSPTEMKGNTALHYACGMGNLELVQWLVEHGADVNKRTNKGASPLNCVGGANGAQIRSFLIQHGAVK